jgi:hypothetical protein
MNAHRAASLARQIGALCIELASALEEVDAPKKRQRPRSTLPAKPPSPEAIERTRRSMRKQGVAA